MYTFDGNIVSDLHKDAFGFRPTTDWRINWQSSTDAEKQQIWDDLLVSLDYANRQQEADEAYALNLFDQLVESVKSHGAPNTHTAICWILDGEKLDDIDYCYGADYISYHFGLAYTNKYREIFAEIAEQRADWRWQEDAV